MSCQLHAGQPVVDEEVDMFKDIEQVRHYFEDEGIVAVDLKFGDLDGRWHHVTLPARRFDAQFVERGVDLHPALERAVASGKPAVIHARVDPDANVDPPGLWLWEAARTGKM